MQGSQQLDGRIGRIAQGRVDAGEAVEQGIEPSLLFDDEPVEHGQGRHIAGLAVDIGEHRRVVTNGCVHVGECLSDPGAGVRVSRVTGCRHGLRLTEARVRLLEQLPAASPPEVSGGAAAARGRR